VQLLRVAVAAVVAETLLLAGEPWWGVVAVVVLPVCISHS